jgi:hypothetical protein
MSGEKEWAIGSPITPRTWLVALIFNRYPYHVLTGDSESAATLTKILLVFLALLAVKDLPENVLDELIRDIEALTPRAPVYIPDERNATQNAEHQHQHQLE